MQAFNQFLVGAVFLAGDIGQRIFRLPFSWAKLGLDIDPMTGEETEQAFARFYRTPPAVVARAIAIMSTSSP